MSTTTTAVATNNVIPPPYTQFCDATGVPLAGGSVYTFAADGSTPKTTYEDIASATPNANPVPLDGAGRARIYGQGQYSMAVFDALGNAQYSWVTQDPAASLGISPAMLAVIQAATVAQALELLGVQAQATPWGVPLPFAGATPPAGWALCYGQALSRTQNPNLFTAIGTTWGVGDGSTTFNAPDLRGKGWAGADAMGGTAANVLTSASLGLTSAGASIMAVLGLLTGNELTQGHLHGIADVQHEHSISVPMTDFSGHVINGGPFPPGSGSSTLTTQPAYTGLTQTESALSGTTQNIPPIAVGNWIIALG